MRNPLKALGVFIAVIALCAPLIFLPETDTQPASLRYAGVTVTVPPTVVVATTIPGLETTTTTTTTVSTVTPPVTTPTSSTTTTTGPIDVTIAAVGGVYTTPEIIDSVTNPRTDSHDFDPVFAPITPYLAGADYAVASLWPRLAGPEVGFDSETSPNAPRELAFALRKAGIDLVATANQHSLDLGLEGVTGTLDRLEAAGLAHVGTYRSSAERNVPLIVDVSGIKVAFLNYATEVSGTLEGDEPMDFAVARFDPETVIFDANMARIWGANVVVAMIDYGDEPEAQASLEQRALADTILSHGVDIILGSRPSVIQSIGHFYPFVRATHCYVAHSLGDFLAVPQDDLELPEDVPQAGMAVYVHLRKAGLRISVIGVDFLPLYVQTGTVVADTSAGSTTTTGGTTSTTGTTDTTSTTETRGDEATAFRILPVLPGLDPASDIPLTVEDRARMGAIWEYARNQLYRPDEDIVPLAPGQLGL